MNVEGEGGGLTGIQTYILGHTRDFFLKSSINRKWRGLNLIERDNWRGGAGNYAWRLLMA